MGCQDLHSIFDQVGFCFSLLSLKTSLYVLHKPFIKCVFFSCSGCLLFLLTLSFLENQFLIQWSLVYQVFLSQIMSLVLYGKIYYRIQGHLGFLLWSSRSFTVFYFTCRSTISFNFCEGYKCVSRSFFCFGVFCISMLICSSIIEKLSLLHCIAFATLSKISWTHLCGSILKLFILFHYLFNFSPRPHSLDYCILVSRSWSQVKSPSTLFFSFNIVLNILDILPFILDWPYLDNPR